MARDITPRDFDNNTEIDVWLEFDHDFEDEYPIEWEDEFAINWESGRWEAMQAYWD